jgi:hypothetical protein
LRSRGVVLAPTEPEGTRYLSRLSLCLNDHRPLLLSAHVKDDNQPFDADLANPDLPFDGHQKLARGLVHLVRSRFLWNGAWHECIAALMASFAGRGAES